MKSKTIKFWCNVIVISLGIVSILILCWLSDWPNIFNIKWLERPKGDWNIIISILTSYIVTVVFYIIMNLIPDKIKEKEDEEHSLPYRCNMHRDIQLFLTDLLHLWSAVIKCASKNTEIEVHKLDDVLKMFDREVIIKSASNVKLFADSNQIDINRKPILWVNVIKSDLMKIKNRGERVLEKYSKDIPAEIYYSLNYLLGSSPIVGIMMCTFSIYIQNCDKESSLATCIAADVTGNIDLEKTGESINCIYNWINKEYSGLSKELNEENPKGIYKVNITTFFR